MRNSTFRLLPAFAFACAGLLLTQCAPMLGARAASSSKLYAGPSESLLLRVLPLDSVVKAELARAGLDPVLFEEDLNTELRYRFSLRGQEEALDSAAAEAILTVRFKHLQPGSGKTGTFGVVWMETNRDGKTDWTEKTWRLKAKNNVPAAYLSRHVVRLSADEILRAVLATRPRAKEPPPPLQLL